ncbi:hypothetical protein STA1M1_07060 [Sinisalibacter aestuarii]|uniref:Enoyl-CoA hydratase n=2 Tax=Sinisalibacter aestuarii TaxID=2949426 RepID=A0ABQ5LPA4_9RHOB|nr:hypothetical protein STA1M1_07060 [Sinisalibacter aestuarii]
MGERRAAEFLLTGQAMGAGDAAEAGLITRAVPHDELPGEVERVIASVASRKGRSGGITRRLMHAGRTAGLRDHLEAEAENIARLAGEEAAKTSIAAFLAR